MRNFDDLIQQAFNAVYGLARRTTVPFIVEMGDQAESVGTGTLIEVNGRYFIVTAEHIAQYIAQCELGIPIGGHRSEIWVLGSGLIKDVRKYDVAVFRIEDEASVARLKEGWEFLKPENVHLGTLPKDIPIFLYGFPTPVSLQRSATKLGHFR